MNENEPGWWGDIPASGRKTRITIRIDSEIIAWFKHRVEALGGGNYQTLLNQALRDYIRHQNEPLEKILRRVLREELQPGRSPTIRTIRLKVPAVKKPEPVAPAEEPEPRTVPPPPPTPKLPTAWESEQSWGG